MKPVLEIAGLAVGYGGAPALRDVALHVAPGQIVSVIGPNGAGKSTLLNAIMGLLPATGTIRLDGVALHDTLPEARVAAGISLVAERRELFASMSVAENLRLGYWRHRAAGGLRPALEGIYAMFPRLRERARQAAGTLSGGERQMLAMGRALMARPRLLMLDEPSLGLAPLIVADIFRIIVELRAAGVAILLVEQNARAALAVSDYGYVLENGAITHSGRGADLAEDPRVVATYLGMAGT